ncbi:MAG: hypothetical protein ACTSRS_16635 [Candidatus Helarchaeota archaeon]
MALEVNNLPDLLRFIKSDFECAYELIVLFTAIKFKDDEGRFDKERLIDFFMELFVMLEKEGVVLNKKCDPLQKGDREKVLQLLNRQPISALLKSKIFKTFERFDFNLFKEIFNNEEAVLVALKERIVGFFLGRGIEKRQLENILTEWEGTMNEMLKTHALMRIVEGYNKFTLEFLLKFLYQSYSLGAFEKLVSDFQINQKELIDYFNSRLEFPIARIGEPRIRLATEVPKSAEVQMKEQTKQEALKKSAEEHLKSLTEFFHKMREEALEEEEQQMKKKKKRK